MYFQKNPQLMKKIQDLKNKGMPRSIASKIAKLESNLKSNVTQRAL